MAAASLAFTRTLVVAAMVICCAHPVRAQADPSQRVSVESVLIAPSISVEAPARTEGPLTAVHVREGQSVKQGDLLGEVDPRRLELAVQAAQQHLAAARHEAENDLAIQLHRKKLDLAKTELARLTSKVSAIGGVVSDAEVQRKRLAKEQAELELQQAERDQTAKRLEVEARATRLREAELNLEQCRIPSNLDGEVVEILKRRGEWVRPGDAVVKLIRTDRVRAEGMIPVQLAGRHQLVGQPVEVQVSLNGKLRSFRGRVTYVHSDVSSLKRKVRIRAEVANPSKVLRPGMTGAMEIALTPFEKSK